MIADQRSGGGGHDEPDQLSLVAGQRRGDEQQDAAGKRHARRLDEKRDEDEAEQVSEQEIQVAHGPDSRCGMLGR
jgi:hypothetical protein